MDPLTVKRLVDLLTNIVGAVLGGGIVIAIIWWLRSQGVVHRNPLFVKGILQEIPLERRSRVTDVGCGTGWASREVARIATDGDVVGIDVSESAVKKAQALTSQDEHHDYTNLAYIAADVEGIPHPSGYFDYATCSVSFSWFSRPEAALAEMERILKPGGKLYVADVCKDHLLSRILTTLVNCLSPCKENLHSAKDYREFLGRCCVHVRQERLGPLGGLLTVGTKGPATLVRCDDDTVTHLLTDLQVENSTSE